MNKLNTISSYNICNLQRFGKVLRLDVMNRAGSSIIGMGAAIGILLVSSLFNMYVTGGYDNNLSMAGPVFHNSIFTAVLIIGGIILTAGVFQDIHRKESASAYLMLPASALEKVASRIIFAGLIWALFTLIWYSLFSLIAEAFNLFIFDRSRQLFNPLSAEAWQAIAHYLVVQALFLVGAVYFKKHHLFKTILTLFLGGLLFSLLALCIIRLVFHDYAQGGVMMLQGIEAGIVIEQLVHDTGRVFKVLKWIGRILYWILLPLVCWVITYQRFKEVEVQYGI